MRNNNEEKCLFGVIFRVISSKYEEEASSHNAKPLRSEGVKISFLFLAIISDFSSIFEK